MAILDSDILIGFIRGNPNAKLKIDTLKKQKEVLYVTVITACELWQGVFLSKNIAKNAQILKDLLAHFEFLDFKASDAIQFGELYAQLQLKGDIIGIFDILIATIVLRTQEQLITHNISHFNRIPLLNVEDWD